jgi:thiol-disulfide isomerase/thioredoxin
MLLPAQELHVIPEMPEQGEKMKLTFTPGSDQQDTAFSTPQLYVLLWPAEPGDPEFKSYEMDKMGESWTTELRDLPDNIALLQMKVVDETTGAEATPEDQFWTQGFYQDGEMMPASWYRLSSSYSQRPDRKFAQSGAEMFRDTDAERTFDIRKQGYEVYPEDLHVARMYLQNAARKASGIEEKERLRQLAMDLVEKYPDEPIALSSAGHALRSMEFEEALADVREQILERFPQHSAADYYRYEAISEADEEEQRQKAETFITDFPDSNYKIMAFQSFIFPHYSQQEDWQGLYEFLNSASIKEHGGIPGISSLVVNSIAEAENSQESGRWALRFVALDESLQEQSYDTDFTERAPYLTDRDWENFNEQRREAREEGPSNMMRVQKARALAMAGWASKAEELAGEITGDDKATGSSFMNGRLAEVYQNTGNQEKLLEIGEYAIRQNAYDDTLEEKYRDAWLAKHTGRGSQAYENHLGELIEASKDILREELAANMLVEQAADFTLPTLEGSEISLSDLEGKVVIIDFWATWCGPCVEAFPVFQEVVDAYADNEDVVFLAVNTFEGEYSDERVQKAADFMEKHELDFPVLFDMDEDKVAGDYAVQGIPTQVAIGRDGKLRFEKVGFTGAGMTTSMELKIEMLLAREYSAINSD